MDQTLMQLLQNLVDLSLELQQVKNENARLKQVIDSKLPVHEISAEDLQAAVDEPAS